MRQYDCLLSREELPDRNAFPENLRDSLGDPALAGVVTQVVERSGECATFQPLLGILVYSYAAGIYPSEEIARLLSTVTGFFEDDCWTLDL